ncbi:MAG: IclR family transcriptional regulator C-terminal domain-containing protein [Nocardioides sp.]|uniref:IclR family transcriptional regulator n=1 Tax=Nocardioides sp. TaxID=35761 RepID=UPI0039E712DC
MASRSVRGVERFHDDRQAEPRATASTAAESPAGSGSGGSQTLERGLRVLALLADHADGLTVSAISAAMDTHRAGVYRMLRPLEAAQLIERRADGTYALGLGLVALASNVRSQLQAVASEELQLLADELEATCALTIRNGEEAFAAIVQQPTRSHMHLAYSRGLRHDLNTSAAGLAILAANPPRENERAEIARARKRGYAFSQNELFAGVSGVAVPVYESESYASASVSAVWLGDSLTEKRVADALIEVAGRIEATLRQEAGFGLKPTGQLRT